MALSISCGNPPPILIPTPYTSTLVASGGTPAYTYSITAGILPPGLTLNTSTGVISGTPTTPGIWIVTAKVTDSTTATATVQCSFTANQASWLWLADFFSTTDGWMALPTDGIEIQYNIWRYWPIADPSADYQVGEVLLEMVNPDDGVTAKIFYNYNFVVGAPDETVSIPSGALTERGRYFAVLNNNLTAGVVQYSIGLQLTGASGGLGVTSFFFFQWRDFPWAPGQQDNQPIEYGWLEIQANTNSTNVPVIFQVDGATAYGPFNVNGTFYNRSSTLTLPLAIIGRQWRAVPVGGVGGTSTTIQLEKIVPHPYPWKVTQDGMPIEFGWIEAEINTNGVSIPMEFQLTGASGLQTYNFNAIGTFDARFFMVILPQTLIGSQWRVVPTVAGYTGTIEFFRVDARPYPWTVTQDGLPVEFGWIEMELNTNGISVPLEFQVKGVSGVMAYDFNASGTFDNRFFTIVLPQGLTGTQWRVVPTNAGYAGLIQFFRVDARDYPWQTSDYACPKTFGWLEIQCNTNGAVVPMELQLDGGAQTFDFVVSGTYFDRTNTITLPSDLTGTLWRIVPTTAGYTGLIQLFSVAPKFEKLPCPISHWDSLGQVYGSAGWRFIWQVWLDYQSTLPLLFSIYRDDDVLFNQTTVSAQPVRGVQRFYLPPVNASTGAFNKSQMYFFTLDSVPSVCATTPSNTPQPGSVSCSIRVCAAQDLTFQLYRDGSRVEIRPLFEDQRAGFQQKTVWELLPLQGI